MRRKILSNPIAEETYVYQEGDHFLGKRNFNLRTQDMLDNLQQKCFLKTFP